MTTLVRVLLLTSFLLFEFAGCRRNPGVRDVASNESLSGQSKAQSLVAGYARHVDVEDAVHQTLDSQGDRSFGDFGFRYEPEKNSLQMRVFIVRTFDKDYPERLPQIFTVRNALNDPKIGGRYETDEAVFFHDEDQERMYLIKAFPLSTTTQDSFNQGADRFRAVGARWFYSWFGHVAVQAFGKEPIPTGQVTLANDPYANGAPANGRNASGINLPEVR